jgi:hypothetical protein
MMIEKIVAYDEPGYAPKESKNHRHISSEGVLWYLSLVKDYLSKHEMAVEDLWFWNRIPALKIVKSRTECRECFSTYRDSKQNFNSQHYK